jgi:hypothetical protein
MTPCSWTYLDVNDDPAHEGTEYPGVGHVPDDRGRCAKEHHLGQRS